MAISNDDRMLYLNRNDVVNACNMIDPVAVIRDVLKLHASDQVILPDEAYLSWKNDYDEQVRSLNMPAFLGGSFNSAGTKIINGNIANPSRGLPRASGMTLPFDATSVRVNCIMEGAYLSSLRTASVTMLSAELFKGREIENVAILGAGILAQAHIELLAKRLPQLRSISIFDLDRTRIATLKAELASVQQLYDIEWKETSTAESAIRDAQLIVPVTTTTTGYIQYDWLEPGSILVNISLDDPLPEVVFKANKVIVDDWNLVKNDPRRLLGRMYRACQIVGPGEAAESQPHIRRIDAQLGEVALGTQPGREHADDIILVNPFGLAIEDIALATHVYQAALEMNMGVWLER
jgi:ornithine cyclodeaminase/alanine dehydrogenase-like protein (mu-crystallin family)